MNEIGRDEIIYDEGFYRPATTVDDTEAPLDEQKAPSTETKQRGFPAVLTLQLILCVLLALTLFVLKTAGSSLWDGFAVWYRAEMSRTLISEADFRSVELNALFGEKEATADEAAPRQR